MNYFDSLTHITADGSWLGDPKVDASLDGLLRAMDKASVARACLVGIADYVDNAVLMSAARAHPNRLVPIAGLNPRILPTIRRVETAVAQIAAEGFAGIKLHPRLNSFDPLDPKSIAVFEAAADYGLVVFLDTLFRQRGLATKNAPDTIDYIANACPETRIVLLHGAGPSMLELWEIVRMRPRLMIDFSFSIMRYAESRLDEDMRFFMRTSDQLVCVGSDFPEYMPVAAFSRFRELTDRFEDFRIQNMAYKNLERLFANYGGAR